MSVRTSLVFRILLFASFAAYLWSFITIKMCESSPSSNLVTPVKNDRLGTSAGPPTGAPPHSPGPRDSAGIPRSLVTLSLFNHLFYCFGKTVSENTHIGNTSRNKKQTRKSSWRGTFIGVVTFPALSSSSNCSSCCFPKKKQKKHATHTF